MDEQEKYDTGIVVGENYADAASRLDKIYTVPITRESNLIEMNLMEVDSYDCGVLDFDMIKGIFNISED